MFYEEYFKLYVYYSQQFVKFKGTHKKNKKKNGTSNEKSIVINMMDGNSLLYCTIGSLSSSDFGKVHLTCHNIEDDRMSSCNFIQKGNLKIFKVRVTTYLTYVFHSLLWLLLKKVVLESACHYHSCSLAEFFFILFFKHYVNFFHFYIAKESQ